MAELFSSMRMERFEPPKSALGRLIELSFNGGLMAQRGAVLPLGGLSEKPGPDGEEKMEA